MRLYSVAEAAEILGVSEKSVRGAVSRGGLPASKVCGRIRISKRDLKHWVKANQVTPREAAGRVSISPLAQRGRRRGGAFTEAMARTEP